jgi:hypothetical protein
MQASNLLIIVSDQHNRNTLGCSGHPLAQTPSLDRLVPLVASGPASLRASALRRL